MKRNSKYALPLIVILLGLIPVIMPNNGYLLLLLCMIGIYILAVSGLDLLFGYSGQISLGHAAFYAIGAYGSAILSIKFNLPVLLTIPLGAVIATIFAILIAIPTVKLVHHFLALVTIGFGQIVYLFIANTDKLTEGHSGINFIPPIKIGTLVFDTNFSYFYIVLVFVILFLVIKNRIVKSRIGRAFIAIKENPVAANGMGINLQYYKVMAFAVSAFFTAFSGGLYAHLVRFISPESFTITQSVLFLTMLLFGGLGTFLGPILGAIILTVISEFIQTTGSYQMLIYGLFLLLVLLYLTDGLLGGFVKLQKYFSLRVRKIVENAKYNN